MTQIIPDTTDTIPPVPPGTADAYRVTWHDVRGPHHSDRLTLAETEAVFSARRTTPGCYTVRLLTEIQFGVWVGDVARRALGAQ